MLNRLADLFCVFTSTSIFIIWCVWVRASNCVTSRTLPSFCFKTISWRPIPFWNMVTAKMIASASPALLSKVGWFPLLKKIVSFWLPKSHPRLSPQEKARTSFVICGCVNRIYSTYLFTYHTLCTEQLLIWGRQMWFIKRNKKRNVWNMMK